MMVQYPKDMIVLQTHDMALMWSRFERIGAIMGCILLAVIFDFAVSIMGGFPPNWILSSIMAIVGQLLVLKCWMDLIIHRKPGKNCWEFERKTK